MGDNMDMLYDWFEEEEFWDGVDETSTPQIQRSMRHNNYDKKGYRTGIDPAPSYWDHNMAAGDLMEYIIKELRKKEPIEFIPIW